MDKWRYHPGVVELAAIAGSGRLGDVHGLSTTRIGWGQKHTDVDSAWVLAPHDLAIALEILGRVPRAVSAVGVVSGNQVMHLEATLAAGAAWHTLRVSSRTPEYRRAAVLHCSEGTASLVGGWETQVSIRRKGDAESEGERIETAGELPLLAELRAFVEHLRGGPPPKSSVEEGAQIVTVIEQLRGLVRSP
jgi:predicted dehydrogenase